MFVLYFHFIIVYIGSYVIFLTVILFNAYSASGIFHLTRFKSWEKLLKPIIARNVIFQTSRFLLFFALVSKSFCLHGSLRLSIITQGENIKYLGQSDESVDKLFRSVLARQKFKYYDLWFLQKLYSIRSLNYYADIADGLFTHLISFKMFSLNLLYNK